MSKDTKISTILFDVGWPIVDEGEAHRAWNEQLKQIVLAETGKKLEDAEIKKYEDEAVRCYAPSMFSYVIWQLVQPDKKLFYKIRAEFDSAAYMKYYKLQPDIKNVLQKLSGHFKLGLAANQPKAAIEYLESEGVLKYFRSKLVSREIGFSKPDIRMFMRVLEDIGSSAEESLMVGDRLDNDIIPAKRTGMKTAWLKVGPYRNQKLRYPNEEPDYIIATLLELLDIPLIKNDLR